MIRQGLARSICEKFGSIEDGLEWEMFFISWGSFCEHGELAGCIREAWLAWFWFFLVSCTVGFLRSCLPKLPNLPWSAWNNGFWRWKSNRDLVRFGETGQTVGYWAGICCDAESLQRNWWGPVTGQTVQLFYRWSCGGLLRLRQDRTGSISVQELQKALMYHIVGYVVVTQQQIQGSARIRLTAHHDESNLLSQVVDVQIFPQTVW